MLVYEDIFTSDEVISDSYGQGAPFDDADLADIGFEVKSRRIKKVSEDFGIAANADADADAGAVGEEAGGGAETVIDVVDSFFLEQYGMNKNEFKVYVKAYMGHLIKHLEANHPDRVAPFKAGVGKLMKKVLEQFDSCDFFMCKNYVDYAPDNKALPIIAYYHGEDPAPRFVFLKDGLKEVKC